MVDTAGCGFSRTYNVLRFVVNINVICGSRGTYNKKQETLETVQFEPRKIRKPIYMKCRKCCWCGHTKVDFEPGR